MIIDSHTHYAHARYDHEFPYPEEQNGIYSVQRATREQLLANMKTNGIVGIIEAAIGLDGIENQIALASGSSLCTWITVGVHPTRCIHTPWKFRKKVTDYANTANPVAIGETGLDYHYPRKKQHRLRQNIWFRYHLRLADRLKLPLVLHIRSADKYALPILQKYRFRLHGGVVHCFSGDAALAEQYINLGFALGIGGKLLCDDEQGKTLCETIKHVPLDALVAETDAPFVLPDMGKLPCSRKQLRKLCNSSLILPAVIRKIAELKSQDYETTERAIYRNTIRIFRLPIREDDNNGSL